MKLGKQILALKKPLRCFGMLVLVLISLAQAEAKDTTQFIKKWAFHGSLGLSLQVYNTNQFNQRMRPFTYTLTGAPVVTLFGKQVPMTVIISEQDRRFVQPYNQIGLSPKGKWFTAHLGHRNIYFSNYTLAGTTVLGAGFEMNPGKFRMGAMGGQINRAVTNLDLIRNPSGLNVGGRFQYERWGYCARIGVGKENKYFDFVLFQGWDKKGSVNPELADTTGVTPAENLAFGIVGKIPLGKKLFWDIDAAISAYTGDQREQANTEGWIQKIYSARFSSQLFTAGRTSLSYMGARFSLRMEYKRVDPDFKTMGMYFIQSDLQQITLSPGFGLFKSKVRINGSVGIERDNLLKSREATTERLITNSTLSFTPGKGKYGLDLNYSNFGITQSPGLRPVNDTIRIAQTNASYSMNQRYTFKTKTRITSLLLLAMYQQLTDLNIFTSSAQENQSKIANLSYTTSPLQKGFGYTASITLSDFVQNGFQYTLMGGSLAGNYNLKDNRLQTSLMGSYQTNSSGGTINGGVLNMSLGLMTTLKKKHSLSARATWLNSTNTAITQQNYQETIGQIDYRFSF